jgi:hypothetical protein
LQPDEHSQFSDQLHAQQQQQQQRNDSTPARSTPCLPLPSSPPRQLRVRPSAPPILVL